MELSQKVKTALDETRILILGAQILLGFQFRGAFSEVYEELPAHAHILDSLALGLMVVAVGLLIAPGPYHRIVEGGEDTGAFHAVVTGIADLALLPFALAFGLDVFLSIERVFGGAGAIAAGSLAALIALALWYGMPRARRRSEGQRERAMTEAQRDERSTTPLHAKIEQMLTEARVILPGAQALFGFQLAIVLTRPFAALSPALRIAHAISLGLVALAIILLMAPAAYHRIVFAGEDTEEMHRVGSLLVTAATAPLAFGLAGDILVVIGKIAGPAAGAGAGGAGFVLLVALWYGYPLAAALRRRRQGAAARSTN
ncbi:MAG TPA: DUF6328 family protein [Stellaceae bacterium]|nr:DUF6328 family protein [Stellaceae bacterium]